jgi:hypothetical protein
LAGSKAEQLAESIPGTPTALAVHDTTVYLATTAGLFEGSAR